MKNLHLVLFAVFGIILVGVFWWGFGGYIASGSDGPLAAERLHAFWIGGIAYLALLIISTIFFIGSTDKAIQTFSKHVWKNLKWTVIALLCCFPVAFIFISFLAPPFILAASAIALMASAFVGQEQASDGS